MRVGSLGEVFVVDGRGWLLGWGGGKGCMDEGVVQVKGLYRRTESE